jgi:hypothetical protein
MEVPSSATLRKGSICAGHGRSTRTTYTYLVHLVPSVGFRTDQGSSVPYFEVAEGAGAAEGLLGGVDGGFFAVVDGGVAGLMVGGGATTVAEEVAGAAGAGF